MDWTFEISKRKNTSLLLNKLLWIHGPKMWSIGWVWHYAVISTYFFCNECFRNFGYVAYATKCLSIGNLFDTVLWQHCTTTNKYKLLTVQFCPEDGVRMALQNNVVLVYQTICHQHTPYKLKESNRDIFFLNES
jgi:hypothetical protein